MSERVREQPIPRALLVAMFGLALATLVAVLVAQRLEVGLMLTGESAPAERRSLVFADAPDGALLVAEAETDRMVALLPAGEEGFIRGVLRGLSRGRAITRTEGEEVYVLTRWRDGRLSIADPVSGAEFDLNSFGRDNLNAFAQLLPSREETR